VDEKFRARQAGDRALHAFLGCVKAGLQEDGPAGVAPIIAFGEGSFSATGRGRLSAPTTAFYTACADVMGRESVVLTTEHRSTKCCAACGLRLQHVHSRPTPRAIERFDAKEARAAAGSGPPPRPLREWSKVRGLMRCVNAACARGGLFVNRDRNAARNILAAFLALPLAEHTRRDGESRAAHRIQAAAAFVRPFRLPGPPPLLPPDALAGGSGWDVHLRRVGPRPPSPPPWGAGRWRAAFPPHTPLGAGISQSRATPTPGGLWAFSTLRLARAL
jgi:hypothetical protein